MTKSKTLLLTAGFMLALTGASFAHDGQDKMGGGDGWKGHHHECVKPDFTDAQKELLRSTMKQTFSENKLLHEKLHQLRKEMFALTKADRFDQQAFLNKSAEATRLRSEMEANRDKAFVAIAPQFSPEQRTMLLKMRMHHKHRHGHGMGGKKWDHMKKDQAPADATPPDATAPVQ